MKQPLHQRLGAGSSFLFAAPTRAAVSRAGPKPQPARVRRTAPAAAGALRPPAGSGTRGRMSGQPITLAGASLVARASGALWWPAERLLAVADLHLCRSERLARRGGALLPPYETAATLDRLAAEVAALAPARVVASGTASTTAPPAPRSPRPTPPG